MNIQRLLGGNAVATTAFYVLCFLIGGGLVWDYERAHKELKIEFAPPIWRTDPAFVMHGTAPNGETVNTYFVWTPGASIASPEAAPMACRADNGGCVPTSNSGWPRREGDRGPLRWWWSGDLVEVRPVVLPATYRDGSSVPALYQWTDAQCETLARNSLIFRGYLHDLDRATFIRRSDQGGCILRLP